MAKEFAKVFYNSKAWKDCRDSYFDKQFGMCEACDKSGYEVHHKIYLTPKNIIDSNISLNHDNLMLLCKTCHNQEHKKSYRLHELKMRKKRPLNDNLEFNSNGELVKRKNVFIIWGAPASGKTTYVKEHKGKYDIVFDMDYIISALSLQDNDKADITDCLDFAKEFRNTFYNIVEQRSLYFENVWIIAGLHNKVDRIQLAKRLQAELIYMDTSRETCKERVKLDDSRLNKLSQIKNIDYYYDNLEIDSPPISQ